MLVRKISKWTKNIKIHFSLINFIKNVFLFLRLVCDRVYFYLLFVLSKILPCFSRKIFPFYYLHFLYLRRARKLFLVFNLCSICFSSTDSLSWYWKGIKSKWPGGRWRRLLWMLHLCQPASVQSDLATQCGYPTPSWSYNQEKNHQTKDQLTKHDVLSMGYPNLRRWRKFKDKPWPLELGLLHREFEYSFI